MVYVVFLLQENRGTGARTDVLFVGADLPGIDEGGVRIRAVGEGEGTGEGSSIYIAGLPSSSIQNRYHSNHQAKSAHQPGSGSTVVSDNSSTSNINTGHNSNSYNSSRDYHSNNYYYNIISSAASAVGSAYLGTAASSQSVSQCVPSFGPSITGDITSSFSSSSSQFFPSSAVSSDILISSPPFSTSSDVITDLILTNNEKRRLVGIGATARGEGDFYDQLIITTTTATSTSNNNSNFLNNKQHHQLQQQLLHTSSGGDGSIGGAASGNIGTPLVVSSVDQKLPPENQNQQHQLQPANLLNQIVSPLNFHSPTHFPPLHLSSVSTVPSSFSSSLPIPRKPVNENISNTKAPLSSSSFGVFAHQSTSNSSNQVSSFPNSKFQVLNASALGSASGTSSPLPLQLVGGPPLKVSSTPSSLLGTPIKSSLPPGGEQFFGSSSTNTFKLGSHNTTHLPANLGSLVNPSSSSSFTSGGHKNYNTNNNFASSSLIACATPPTCSGVASIALMSHQKSAPILPSYPLGPAPARTVSPMINPMSLHLKQTPSVAVSNQQMTLALHQQQHQMQAGPGVVGQGGVPIVAVPHLSAHSSTASSAVAPISAFDPTQQPLLSPPIAAAAHLPFAPPVPARTGMTPNPLHSNQQQQQQQQQQLLMQSVTPIQMHPQQQQVIMPSPINRPLPKVRAFYLPPFS